MFALLLVKANDLKDESTPKKQPQVNNMKLFPSFVIAHRRNNVLAEESASTSDNMKCE